MSQTKAKGKKNKSSPSKAPMGPPKPSGFTEIEDSILGVPTWDGKPNTQVAKGAPANINDRMVTTPKEDEMSKKEASVNVSGTCAVCDTAKGFFSSAKKAFMKPVGDVLPDSFISKLPAKAGTAPVGGVVIGSGLVLGGLYWLGKKLFAKKAA